MIAFAAITACLLIFMPVFSVAETIGKTQSMDMAQENTATNDNLSLKSPIHAGSLLFAGSLMYATVAPREGGTTGISDSSVKFGSFIANRLAIGPEMSYLTVASGSNFNSWFEGGAFVEYFIGHEKGNVLGRIGLGIHHFEYGYSDTIYNPRIGLEVLFSNKTAFDIELGYQKPNSKNDPLNEITYISVGLLGFAY